MGLRRYPGATPFSKDQSRIFFGRDRDIEKMLTLIKVEKKVLLYSKSGLGKTSLLEAGVIPKLQENQPHYTPVSIRFYDSKSEKVSPVERVIAALENTIGKVKDITENLLDHLENQEDIKSSLWAYFKKLQLTALSKSPEGKDKIFLLVFDQFEELFSYSESEIENFKNEIYEITQPDIPSRFMSHISKARRRNRELFDADAIESLQERLNIKIILAIRSDRLSLLDRLSDKITDIRDVYIEIHPLNEPQAREAIINPAKDPDPSFETHPYTFKPDAVEMMISTLTDKGEQSIETTQLQIVCHKIEEIAEEKNKTANPSKEVVIQVKDLPEFSDIFFEFYEDSINKLPENSRETAKKLIEEELITKEGQRISLDVLAHKAKLNDEELALLVNTHLLRSERNHMKSISYEVSHDTLVEPILKSRKTRKDKEEKIRLIQEQIAERERLEKEKEEERVRLEEEKKEEIRKLKEKQEHENKIREIEEKNNEKIRQLKELEHENEVKRMHEKAFWQRIAFVFVSFLLLVSVGLGVWGFQNYCDTKKESIKTMNKEREATLLYIDFMDQQFKHFFDKGKTFMDDGEYSKAIENFKEAKMNLHTIVAGKEIDTTSSCNIQELFTNSLKNELKMNIIRYQDSLLPIARKDSIENSILISAKIDSCNLLASKANWISDLYDSARVFIERKDYVNALHILRQAYVEDPNKNETTKRFDNTKRDAIRFYESTRLNAAEIPDANEEARALRLLKQVNNIQL